VSKRGTLTIWRMQRDKYVKIAKESKTLAASSYLPTGEESINKITG
jgi:hypothetical protein